MKVSIRCEKEGWILHRMAVEIQKIIPEARINADYPEADIFYYINYGYYQKYREGKINIGCFTHHDPNHLSNEFEKAAKDLDHCIAISEATAEELIRFGIPKSKISVVLIGADESFQPQLTLGIVGRTYKGGRKGEDIVEALVKDDELMNKLQIVATNDSWGVPVWDLPLKDFYNAIDYLLVPARIEGGPVPFMEALACGTLSIAPPIGVIPQFPHLEYPVGDIQALKKRIMTLKEDALESKQRYAKHMSPYTWSHWASEHKRVFEELLSK